MFESLFGAEMPLAARFFIAFVVVLLLIGATAWLVRRVGADRISGAARSRQPRLGVVDSAAVDNRRRLVIVRRDNVEHLIMIGGPNDVVVETNLARGNAGARTEPQREVSPSRTDASPRAAGLIEPTSWPLQPEPAAGSAPSRTLRATVAEDAVQQWASKPERYVKPPSERSAKPTADHLKRAEPVVELSPSQAPVAPAPNAAARTSRGPETLAPRVPETTRPAAETQETAPVVATPAPRAKAPEPVRMIAPQVTPAAEPAPASAAGDANLTEMAHRLEAALRRPVLSETRDLKNVGPEPVATPRPASADAKAAGAEVKPVTRADSAKPPAPSGPFEDLEQEMASLLGRQSKA